MKTNKSLKKINFCFSPVRVYLNFSTGGGRIILHICKVLLEEKIRHCIKCLPVQDLFKEFYTNFFSVLKE